VIIFKLICKDCEISFNSWFSSSAEYEKLKKKKFINCHSCNSLNIEKTLMSPSIFRSKNTTKIDHLESKYKEIKKTILDYQNYVKKNLNYVGENFAYEARSIHYKNKKVSKGIYGTATKKDLKDLKEEGISAEQIPWVKNTTN
tara:strand:- start:295 stop:723 length:429 start_codon:yes stop_codon:yes gene_type:complete